MASGGINHFNARDFAESAGWGALFGAATSVAGYGAGKAIGRFFLRPNTIGGELELRGPPGYTRSVGDMGLKGIGKYDDLEHLTRRIDVLGREHYNVPTHHADNFSWDWSARAPGDGWWATELRPTKPASYLDKLLIFLLS